MSVKDWNDLAEAFNICPHPLNGKILKTALAGTNPYVYTDWENNVLFDQQGVPLGSNGGILKALSEVFGFSLNISIFNSNVIWDNQTGKYVAIPTLVCVRLTKPNRLRTPVMEEDKSDACQMQ